MGKHYHSKKRARRLFRQMAELQDQLTDTALMLSEAITARIADAPLNQLSTSLGVVVDRMMKLDEYMKHAHPPQTAPSTGIIVQYDYDGQLHDTPPEGYSADFIHFDPWRDGWGRVPNQPLPPDAPQDDVQPPPIPLTGYGHILSDSPLPLDHVTQSHNQPAIPPQPP
jgi:hypothetical protein